jgi:hypothetical protein
MRSQLTGCTNYRWRAGRVKEDTRGRASASSAAGLREQGTASFFASESRQVDRSWGSATLDGGADYGFRILFVSGSGTANYTLTATHLN